MQRVVYVTSSPFKEAENKILVDSVKLSDGTPVSDVFRFDIRQVRVQENLEIRLETLVEEEAVEAYLALKVPLVVEHAGLIFEDYLRLPPDQQYPAGLTKPMWDALGDTFIEETGSSGRSAAAVAVVAHCDGQKVKTFRAETAGHIADRPRGGREFYWDTVFIPDGEDGEPGELTYAEIVEDKDLGLAHKVERLSQSSKAMLAFLEWRRTAPPPALWPAT